MEIAQRMAYRELCADRASIILCGPCALQGHSNRAALRCHGNVTNA